MIKKFITCVKKYFINVLIAFDQLFNTIAFGSPDETISSRIGRNYYNSWMRHFVDDLFGRNHCKDSIEPKDNEDDAILK